MERVNDGEFRLYIWPKANPKPFTPFKDEQGNVIVASEEVLILDDRFPPKHHRNEVVRTHCYITDTGAIGASGLLDPKEIMIWNANYRGNRNGKLPCDLCEGDMIPADKRFRRSVYRPVSK